MLEINVTVNAPGISEAINNLAAAINNKNEAVSVQNALVQAASTAPSTVYTPVQAAPTAPAPAPNPSPYDTAEVPSAPVPQTVASVAPTAPAPIPTVETLGRAGAALCEQGKMPQLIELLNKYGVQTVLQLKDASPEVLVSFANDLKALGAKL